GRRASWPRPRRRPGARGGRHRGLPVRRRRQRRRPGRRPGYRAAAARPRQRPPRATRPEGHLMIDRMQQHFGFATMPFGRDLAPAVRPAHGTAALPAQAYDALAGEAAERGRTPVLIIDEAHLLDHSQLESVRMLTNHDMDSKTPFATVLIGQPTLRRMIKLGVLAALDQRIAVRYQMTGMTPEETGSYIQIGRAHV